jgi:plastocyanin
MRAARLLPAALLLGLAVAACAGPAQPGWTFAPPPSAAPSSAPSAEPGGGAPSVAPSAAPSVATGGTVLNVEASGMQFAETSLEAPAGQAFTIVFDNQDQGVPHNIQIADGSGNLVFTGADVQGPGKVTYDVGPLQAGSYKFTCRFHPNMVGDLTVK